MESVVVSLIEPSQFDDFKQGNPIQVRAVLPADNNDKKLKKGDSIAVEYENKKMQGKLVSDPIAISPQAGEGNTELSLEITKAE